MAPRLLAATVVLVQPTNPPPGMTEALVRIHGELASAGFAMEIVDASAVDGAASESRGWLEQLATSRGADAVVAMMGDRTPDWVEVWVIDKVTGKSVVRRVPFQPRSARGPETLAIQAIELLRASFLEIDLSSRARASEVASAPPPEVVHFVEQERKSSRPEHFALAVGASALMSFDGLGPAVMPLARLDWAPRPWLILHAEAAGLGTRPSVETKIGSATVAQEFALLGASYRFRSGKRLQPFVTLSAGVLHVSVDGKAEPESLYAGSHDGRWAFLLDGGFGVRLALRDRFHALLRVHAQMAEPYPAIRFADTVVATSGRPSLLLTLTLGAWL